MSENRVSSATFELSRGSGFTAGVTDDDRLRLYRAYQDRAWGEYCGWKQKADAIARKLSEEWRAKIEAPATPPDQRED